MRIKVKAIREANPLLIPNAVDVLLLFALLVGPFNGPVHVKVRLRAATSVTHSMVLDSDRSHRDGTSAVQKESFIALLGPSLPPSRFFLSDKSFYLAVASMTCSGTDWVRSPRSGT